MKFQFLGLCMYLCAHNHETLELLVNFRLETLALVFCSILSEECVLYKCNQIRLISIS